MKSAWLIALVLALPLLADDRSKDLLSVTHTERFNVSADATIRLQNSFGELDVDGWDRPEVEVTMVRSTERLHGQKDRAEAERRLNSVQIAAKQNGNDVAVSTVYPPRDLFTHPLSRRSDIEINYRIKAPRASKLIIDHNSGGVNISDISGDIHATLINGQITLTLASDRQYAIDAQSRLGAVYSDFEGRDHSRRILGEEFSSLSSGASAKLFLRTRVGDIVIAKLHGPPAN